MALNDLNPESPTVLVTGASQGIGRATALQLAQLGHAVLGVSRCAPEETSTSELILSESRRLTWRPLDLSKISEVETFASATEIASIRVLVLSAVDYGCDRRRPASQTPAEEWQRVITTNCTGQCVLVSRLLPTLTARSPGVIVNVSSEVALFPGPGRAAYASSKTALHAMLRAVTQENATALRVYQLVPTFQCITPGIRRRRPLDYDFSSYGDPGIIATAISQLVPLSGATMQSGTYLIQPSGKVQYHSESTGFSVDAKGPTVPTPDE
jgi:cyclitol oxidoreductase